MRRGIWEELRGECWTLLQGIYGGGEGRAGDTRSMLEGALDALYKDEKEVLLNKLLA